jgi:hypothetical protein
MWRAWNKEKNLKVMNDGTTTFFFDAIIVGTIMYSTDHNTLLV